MDSSAVELWTIADVIIAQVPVCYLKVLAGTAGKTPRTKVNQPCLPLFLESFNVIAINLLTHGDPWGEGV
jgi:hypothetical protein